MGTPSISDIIGVNRGPVIEPPIKTITGAVKKVFPELDPWSRAKIAGPSIYAPNQTQLAGYGLCNQPDTGSHPFRLSYLSTAAEDDYGFPNEGGPQPDDDVSVLETTPGNTIIDGLTNPPPRTNPYQTNTKAGNGTAIKPYGTTNHKGKKAPGKKDKTKVNPTIDILLGKGLYFATTAAGTPDTPSGTVTAGSVGSYPGPLGVGLGTDAGTSLSYDTATSQYVYSENGAEVGRYTFANHTWTLVSGIPTAPAIPNGAVATDSGSTSGLHYVTVDLAMTAGALAAGLLEGAGDDANGLQVNVGLPADKTGLVIKNNLVKINVDNTTTHINDNGELVAGGSGFQLSDSDAGYGISIDDEDPYYSSPLINVHLAAVAGAVQSGLCTMGGDDGKGLSIDLATSGTPSGAVGFFGGARLGGPTWYPGYLPSTFKEHYEHGWQAYTAGDPITVNPYDEKSGASWWNVGHATAQQAQAKPTDVAVAFGGTVGTSGGSSVSGGTDGVGCGGATVGSGLTIVAGNGNQLGVYLAPTPGLTIEAGPDNEGLSVLLDEPSGLQLQDAGLSIKLASDAGSGSSGAGGSGLFIDATGLGVLVDGITVTLNDQGELQASDQPITPYTAGDGIDITGFAVSVHLCSVSGLTLDGGCLAANPDNATIIINTANQLQAVGMSGSASNCPPPGGTTASGGTSVAGGQGTVQPLPPTTIIASPAGPTPTAPPTGGNTTPGGGKQGYDCAGGPATEIPFTASANPGSFGFPFPTTDSVLSTIAGHTITLLASSECDNGNVQTNAARGSNNSAFVLWRFTRGPDLQWVSMGIDTGNSPTLDRNIIGWHVFPSTIETVFSVNQFGAPSGNNDLWFGINFGCENSITFFQGPDATHMTEVMAPGGWGGGVPISFYMHGMTAFGNGSGTHRPGVIDYFYVYSGMPAWLNWVDGNGVLHAATTNPPLFPSSTTPPPAPPSVPAIDKPFWTAGYTAGMQGASQSSNPYYSAAAVANMGGTAAAAAAAAWNQGWVDAWNAAQGTTGNLMPGGSGTGMGGATDGTATTTATVPANGTPNITTTTVNEVTGTTTTVATTGAVQNPVSGVSSGGTTTITIAPPTSATSSGTASGSAPTTALTTQGVGVLSGGHNPPHAGTYEYAYSYVRSGVESALSPVSAETLDPISFQSIPGWKVNLTAPGGYPADVTGFKFYRRDPSAGNVFGLIATTSVPTLTATDTFSGTPGAPPATTGTTGTASGTSIGSPGACSTAPIPIAGSPNIAGDLSVGGNVSIAGTLSVNGAATFNSGMTLNGITESGVPMELIGIGANHVLHSIAQGSNGQILELTNGTPTWTANPVNILSHKGDLLYANANATSGIANLSALSAPTTGPGRFLLTWDAATALPMWKSLTVVTSLAPASGTALQGDIKLNVGAGLTLVNDPSDATALLLSLGSGSGGGGVVTDVNGISGSVSLTAGPGIALGGTGQDIDIQNTGILSIETGTTIITGALALQPNLANDNLVMTYTPPSGSNPAIIEFSVPQIGYTSGDLTVDGTGYFYGDITMRGQTGPATNAFVLALRTGVDLGIGTYEYVYTYLTAGGETLPSPVATIVTTAGNQNVHIVTPLIAASGVTGIRIYRSPVNSSGNWLHLIDVSGQASSVYVDHTVDSQLGPARPPTTGSGLGRLTAGPITAPSITMNGHVVSVDYQAHITVDGVPITSGGSTSPFSSIQTSAPPNGAGGALPANADGYAHAKLLDGTDILVPYWAVTTAGGSAPGSSAATPGILTPGA